MNDTTPFDLDALLHEQRRRWEAGAPIQVEALLECHADLRDRKETLLDLINHEIVLRGEFEAPPNREEYLRRFPELAAELVMLFEVHEAIEAGSKDTNSRPSPIRACRTRRRATGRRCRTTRSSTCSARGGWGSSTRRSINA